MHMIEQITVALSLCADCFAVALCSSVNVGKIDRKGILRIALVFALIQSGLLLAGCAAGSLFAGMVETVAHVLGFALLAFVGGSMIAEGIRGKKDPKNLNGLKNVIISGVATSIDALAVGAAQSIGGPHEGGVSAVLPIAVFVFTFFCVILGIRGGKAIGSRFGRWAEIGGGVLLVTIGLIVLLQGHGVTA